MRLSIEKAVQDAEKTNSNQNNQPHVLEQSRASEVLGSTFLIFLRLKKSRNVYRALIVTYKA